MTYDLEKDIEYILTIYSEAKQNLNVRQYRFVIFTEEVPANSMCSTAQELPHADGYAEYLVLNRYGRSTDFGEEYGKTRGSWFHIKSPKAMSITVRTCSPDTTTNSFIVTAGECTTAGENDATLSTPTTLSKLAKSSETNCDIHGTYITFDLKADESRYIFVGPESFNTDCFISVSFYMEYKENDNNDDDNNDNNNNNDDDDYDLY